MQSGPGVVSGCYRCNVRRISRNVEVDGGSRREGRGERGEMGDVA